MKNKQTVLFVSAEISPIAKVGGLADVVGSLPQSLKEIGTDSVVALPYYDFLKKNKTLRAKKILTFKLEFNKKIEKVAVFQGTLLETNTTIYLYDRVGASTENIYTSAQMSGRLYVNPRADLERFVFFSLAVAESLDKLPLSFSLVHCHDWHTALVPYLLRHTKMNALFTIHNLANQGLIDGLLMEWLGEKGSDLPKTGDQYNLMSVGLRFSKLINTVSPNYAREILTKEYGCGLEKVIKQEQSKLSGIVNGIDIRIFNPETDKLIYKNFNSSSLEGKDVNKLYLQEKVGLVADKKVAVIGLVSRFVSQKGLDLITERIINLPAQFIFLGEGDPQIEKRLLDLSQKFSNFKVIKGFDLKLAQQIYAGADFFLMPSRFEPCGLGQLIALRYGTLPIVCSVGGLKDTVTDKNGYCFISKTDKILQKTINQALTEFYTQPRSLKAKKIRVMKGDYSWSKSAKVYQKIYNKIANIK